MKASLSLLGHPLLVWGVRALRLLPAEAAHNLSLRLLQLAAAVPGGLTLLRHLCPPPPPSPRSLWGLTLVNAVGLAAGYDKDALALPALAAMGFGHIEVGTVTPLPQPGNPKPRVLRLLADGALLNRMGFPSRGAEFVAQRLAKYRVSNPLGASPLIGVNLGKNKDTPLDRAGDDYEAAARRLAPFADYLAVNVSSPNTPQLRALQTPEYLREIVDQVRVAAQEASGRWVPVVVKLSPDLSDEELSANLNALAAGPAAGLILTNTTVARPDGLSGAQGQTGGLSGLPLGATSLRVLALAAANLPSALPLIASGGILSGEDALARIQAGASLVQLWTGLVVRGPGLIADVGCSLALQGQGGHAQRRAD